MNKNFQVKKNDYSFLNFFHGDNTLSTSFFALSLSYSLIITIHLIGQSL